MGKAVVNTGYRREQAKAGLIIPMVACEDSQMTWAIKGLSGLHEGKIIPLRAGLTFGRQGDVVIDENRVSNLHARIVVHAEGIWALEDNESKNGTKLNGAKISLTDLTLGAVISIGDQGFEVVEIVEEPKVVPLPLAGSKYWYEILAQFVHTHAKKVRNQRIQVVPMQPAVVLDFIRGPQVQTRWVIGYGPRQIGPQCLDLTLIEPSAPMVCFELVPTPQGALFKTQYPDLVRLNLQPIDSQVLRVGDTIQINETLIEVDFIE